jgi:probable rRNA maturation factor
MAEPGSSTLLLFRRKLAAGTAQRLRTFAKRLRTEVTGGRGFLCLITSDDDLRRLNRQFLNKDRATDVLSFPSAEPDGSLGEMAISVERAEEQAIEFGHTLEDEIEVLMLHGVLHLTGMDHERDAGRMRRAETRWRKALGLPSGLIERARGVAGRRRPDTGAFEEHANNGDRREPCSLPAGGPRRSLFASKRLAEKRAAQQGRA